jgi:hypothetical protein
MIAKIGLQSEYILQKEKNMPKLLIDEMLKNLVSWLRIFGIDTAFIRPNSDEDLLQLAKKEERVLITRDRELSMRCKRQNIASICLLECNEDAQLCRIKKELSLTFSFPNELRCAHCNHVLQNVDKQAVLSLIPERIAALHTKYWLCPVCNKAYWQGTHWESIEKKLANIQ